MGQSVITVAVWFSVRMIGGSDEFTLSISSFGMMLLILTYI